MTVKTIEASAKIQVYIKVGNDTASSALYDAMFELENVCDIILVLYMNTVILFYVYNFILNFYKNFYNLTTLFKLFYRKNFNIIQHKML